MEPLSATLTALAFASALKDIIEVGKKIQDAFSKLPANQENARKLSKRILRTLEHMQATYNEDTSNRNKYGAMKASLDSLMEDMITVLAKCQELIPPMTSKKRDKFLIAFYNLKHRDKVERLISELKDQVDESMELFFRLSTMRTEQASTRTEQTTIRTEKTVTTIMYALQKHLPPSDTYLRSTFVQSNYMPLTWISGTIPDHELSKAYLRRELRNIEKFLRHFTSCWFYPPRTLDILPAKVSWHLDHPIMSKSATHQECVMLAFEIQNAMQSRNSSWVCEVGDGLSHLDHLLCRLEMHDEAISVHRFRIDLWSAVASVYPENDAREHLVLAFMALSFRLCDIGQIEQAHSMTDQAMELIQSMPAKSTTERQEMVAQILGQSSRTHPVSAMVLKLAEASLQHLTIVPGIEHVLDAGGQVDVRALGDAVANATHDTLHDHLFTYATLSLQLSRAQVKHGLILEANKSEKQVLTILQHLYNMYPESSKVTHYLLTVLQHLLSSNSALSRTTKSTTAAGHMDHILEKIDILSKLTQIDPQNYVIDLLSSLYTKHQYLLSIGKVREAEEVYNQMLGLGTMAVDPYPDLKLPSETEGDYYLKLAEYHFSWNRAQDAVDTARNAISMFTSLDSMAPGKHSVKHFSALALLSKYLLLMGQYDFCISTGFEALHTLDKSPFRGDENLLVVIHMELLDNTMDALDATLDPKALTWARDINSRIQRLFLSSQRESCLSFTRSPHAYISILQKNDLYNEVGRYLEDFVSRTYGEIMLKICLRRLFDLSDMLKTEGDTEAALKHSQHAMNVSADFFRHQFPFLKAELYNDWAWSHSSLLRDAGRYSESLALSELAVNYARERVHASDDYLTDLIWALDSHANDQLCSLQPQDAIVTANEAIVLSQNVLSNGNGITIFPCRLEMLHISLLNLVGSLGDTGDIDQALLHLASAEDVLIKWEVSVGEELGNARGNQIIATTQARLLFAKGKYVECARIIENVISREREHANGRRPAIAALICELEFAGVVYCTLGRHDDGMSAAAEVSNLKRSIAKSPQLLCLVEVKEKVMTSRGLWKSVQVAKHSLECQHQNSPPEHCLRQCTHA